MRTDTGRVRQHNEDAFLTRPERRLFAVADGMGGHAAGEIASELAVRTLDEAALSPRNGSTLARSLADAMWRANRKILEEGGARSGWEGMGTTLIALAFADDGNAALAHVGDSRAYRLREGRLERLTRDHTWVQDQIDAGRLDAETARRHPYASVLSRVLGLEDLDGIDTAVLDVLPGDLHLLCSDGLTTLVPDEVIAAILTSGEPLVTSAESLITEANERGGVDNCTVVLVRPETGPG